MTALAPKTPKHGLLKARCEEDLELFYTNLARLRHQDTADVVRLALRDYRQRIERQITDPPMTHG